MLDIIRKELDPDLSREANINRVREFLQIIILKILYDSGAFSNIAFVGGTALRLLFDLNRFSEDLDFSVINEENYSWKKLLERITHQLEKYTFQVEINKSRQKTVRSAMVKFKDILYQLNLSSIEAQKLFIRLEIDTNPPKGWSTGLSLISRTHVFTVTHFDLPSLYATKLHACFFRRYTKGRDFYDLLWYLGKKISPNFKLLNNAIRQTAGLTGEITKENFDHFLLEKLAEVDFRKVRQDVERFLVNKEELDLLDYSLIKKLIYPH